MQTNVYLILDMLCILLLALKNFRIPRWDKLNVASDVF